MIGIAVLCLLLCGGILVFALNPDMTSSLAQKLYGNTVDMPPGTEETGEGQTSGNGNISVTLPNGMPGEMNGYVAPSMDQMQIPEDVSGRTGFTPVQPEEQQIPDQEAQNLKETLGSGETGEGLSFSAEEYPYYQMLSENQQSVYRQIYANAQNLTEKFAPEKTVSASDVKIAFEAVIGDHPEMFWLETGYSSKYLVNGQCVEIDLKYNSTADDLESAKQRFDAAAQNLITGADSLDSNYEKEKYVHDALASAVTYDSGYEPECLQCTGEWEERVCRLCQSLSVSATAAGNSLLLLHRLFRWGSCLEYRKAGRWLLQCGCDLG